MPDHLSVSQVNTYLMCPRKYKYRYFDKLEPESKSVALAFGSAVHSAISWWQSELIEGAEPTNEQACRVFRADWTAQLSAGDVDLGGKHPDEMRAMGETLVRLFVERFADDVPETVDERFEVELHDPRTGEALPIPLVGYLDFASVGMVGEIKTTARKCSPSQWMLQLAAYSYAVRKVTGRRPAMRVVELIKTKTPKLEVFDLEVAGSQESWFLEVACEVHRSIGTGAFHPSPSWACKGCEYREACRESFQKAA